MIKIENVLNVKTNRNNTMSRFNALNSISKFGRYTPSGSQLVELLQNFNPTDLDIHTFQSQRGGKTYFDVDGDDTWLFRSELSKLGGQYSAKYSCWVFGTDYEEDVLSLIGSIRNGKVMPMIGNVYVRGRAARKNTARWRKRARARGKKV